MCLPTLSRILLLTSVFFGVVVSEPETQPVPSLPHFTDCFSNNMETFRCRWSRGSYRDRVRLFYLNSARSSSSVWSECPSYSPNVPDECFFSRSYTTVWNSYTVQLRDQDQETVFDQTVFYVYDRVRPDPPYNLSWSLLNGSISGQFYDVRVSWIPPDSADVASGWMTLQYQLQHRNIHTDDWTESDVLDSSHCSVFGLHSNVRYEVRVRCRMFGMKFGDFSKPIVIYRPSQVPGFPVLALLVFGTLCLVVVLLLVIFSQQEKLMILLLPPIPGPKIRGIDPEMLKKGKFCELSSILSQFDFRPELFDFDPEAEFIELDLEEHEPETREPEQNHSTEHCAGFRDDDSGRASCCDPELNSDTETPPSTPSASPPNTTPPELAYTQVSEVRASGNIVLSNPEETQPKARDAAEETEDPVETESDKMEGTEKSEEMEEMEEMEESEKGEEMEETEESEKSEETAKIEEMEETEESEETKESQETESTEKKAVGDTSPPSPAPVYTVVGQNWLLLTPPDPTAPLKPTAEGYVTPDLLQTLSV